MMDKGLPVFRTAEPTIYETGKFIRRVLSGEVKVPQSTVAYLFAADRDNHLNNRNTESRHILQRERPSYLTGISSHHSHIRASDSTLMRS